MIHDSVEQEARQSGKARGVFSVGEHVEALKLAREQDEVKIKHYIEAMSLAVRTLDKQKSMIESEAQSNLITIKELDYGRKYILRSKEAIVKFSEELQVAHNSVTGGIKALDEAIVMIKKLYDSEEEKAKRFKEYFENPGLTTKQILMNRPVGVHPGDPLAEMRKEIHTKNS